MVCCLKLFHKHCFKCVACSKGLTPTTMRDHDQELVGAVTGPVYQKGLPEPQHGLSWRNCWKAIIDSFYIVSVGNLALISLERLHATLYPFNHCLVGKRVYCKIIFCSWLGSFILASVFVILEINEPVACRGAWVSYTFFTLALLTAAYVIVYQRF